MQKEFGGQTNVENSALYTQSYLLGFLFIIELLGL